MKRQEIIKLTKSVIERFHDNVVLTEKQLTDIHNYLFKEQTALHEVFTPEITSTLEYLRDIILEKGYSEISDLQSYFESLLTKAEKEYDETFNECNTNPAKDLDNIKLLHFIGHGNELSGKVRFGNNIRDIFESTCFRVFHTCYSPPELLDLDKLDNMAGSRPDFCFSGSYFLDTKIHASHFTDIDCVFIIELKTGERQRYTNFPDVKPMPFGLNHLDIRPSNVELVSNSIEDKLKCHYDTLIDRLATRQTIFDESFKEYLIEWLLYFKVRNLEIDMRKQRSCSGTWKEWELGKVKEIFYESFHETVRKFYKQFSNEDWTILKSPDGHSWLTTENPGFSVDLDDFTSLDLLLKPDPGLSVKKTSVVYFPLSKDFCLRIQPKLNGEPIIKEDNKQPAIIIKESTDVEFKTINSMTVSTNGELLISADRETLEKFVTP